jgi:CRP/FNR family transcriptional regulator, cyclic AMP receptor protein
VVVIAGHRSGLAISGHLPQNIFMLVELPIVARKRAASAFVAGNGWLAGCGPDFRDWMLGALRWQSVGAGEGISHAGDDGDAMYGVGDGQVYFGTGLGVTDVGTSYFGLPGMWWGYAPLLGGTRIVSAVAAVDSICCSVALSAVQARLRSHPDDWRAIASGLAAFAMQAAGAHADLLIAASDRRVAATILRLGGYRHRMFPALAPASFLCTQEELAGATALSRTTTGKLLRGFEEDGLLKVRYGRMAILDPVQMTALANRSR